MICVLLVLLFPVALSAQVKDIKVFVALCDNETQGIAKVGKSIGDGDKPEANLYWGCSDGLSKVFGKSTKWQSVSKKSDLSDAIMREVVFKHKVTQSVLTAHAYRGSKMKQCYLDFEAALASGDYDFVCYIGHNALMDIQKPDLLPASKKGKTSVSVLACLSNSYCSERLRIMGAKPVLMTRALMYPVSSLLHDGLEVWFIKGNDYAAIRSAAGKAYHRNQVKVNPRMTVGNATGVFAKLGED